MQKSLINHLLIYRKKFALLYFALFALTACKNYNLNGRWISTTSNLTLTFTGDSLRFEQPLEKTTKTIEYKVKKNYICFINEINIKDSIEIIKLTSDNLILKLKVKGKKANKVFIKD